MITGHLDELPLLEIQGLTKNFRGHWTFRPIPAVHNLSLSIPEGGAFGFLGHNGAGKTTTIKCILGLCHTTSGAILYRGSPLTAEHRRSIGYLPELPYFYDHLSVGETLDFFAALHDMTHAERRANVQRVLDLLALSDRTKSPIRSLSKGLQQRLAFAQAIINSPQLLLLDEPFSGLDPLGRKQIRDLILHLKQSGTTIFMSSHILSDVEDVCERVAIMAKGSLCNVFSLADRHKLFGDSHILTIRGAVALPESLRALSTTVTQESRADSAVTILRFDSKDTALHSLNIALDSQLDIQEFRSVSRSLEEIFIDSTQRAL